MPKKTDAKVLKETDQPTKPVKESVDHNCEIFDKWYHSYVEHCDRAYDKTAEQKKTRVEELLTKLETLTSLRLQHTNISEANSLDSKIQETNKILEKEYAFVSRNDKIKKEMKEYLQLNSSEYVYKKILSHPEIKEILITTNAISIITNTLYDKKRSIGHFQIMLKTPTEHCSIENLAIKNLEYCVKGQYDHWHVQEQSPCLAGWNPVLQRHLDTYQLFLFFDTLIHYLTLTNDEHAYIKKEAWFEDFNASKHSKKIKLMDDQVQSDHDTSATQLGTAGWSEGTISTSTIGWGGIW